MCYTNFILLRILYSLLFLNYKAFETIVLSLSLVSNVLYALCNYTTIIFIQETVSIYINRYKMQFLFDINIVLETTFKFNFIIWTYITHIYK